MIKLIIMAYAIGGTEPVNVGQLMHPFDFTDVETCHEFATHEGWEFRTTDYFAFDYECVDYTPTLGS